jgi:hypothetical protein
MRLNPGKVRRDRSAPLRTARESSVCNSSLGAYMSGYSGTPLVTKLGIKAGAQIYAVGAPENYRKLLEPLPRGVRFTTRLAQSTDIVHVFSTRRAELARALARYRETLGPTAAVWVSWPKKAAAVVTDISENAVREIALPLGFVDIKVCAVTEVWSALKLVVRKELR